VDPDRWADVRNGRPSTSAGARRQQFTGNAGGSVPDVRAPAAGLAVRTRSPQRFPGTIGDTIVVEFRHRRTGVSSFTLYRQPARYLVTGFLSVWSSSGVKRVARHRAS